MNNFDHSPFLVIWEVTQACDLACVHCRASAQPAHHPLELATQEGLRLLAEIREIGNPLMVFTGGDPLKRSDLLELLKESVRLGLRTTVTPSATPLLTLAAVQSFCDCGVSRMAISRLKGKCGRCVYRNLCGGSRSRAFAASGDYLAEDPRCIYQPSLDVPFPSVKNEGVRASIMSQGLVD